jgi:hypothetical protein
VLAIGIIVCGVNWGSARADLAGAQTERDALATELANTQAERDALATELADTQAERDALAIELANTQAERDALAIELANTQAERDALAIELADTQAERDALAIELANTQAELEATQDERDYWQAEADYWQSMYYSVEHPSNFDSLSELEAWLAGDDTDSYTYIPDTFDCDDFALTLYEHAREDGYIIYFQVVDYELVYDEGAWSWYIEEGYYPYYYHEFNFWTDEDLGGVGEPDHAMNVAIVGNDVYLIEPQTDNVWLWCCLD